MSASSDSSSDTSSGASLDVWVERRVKRRLEKGTRHNPKLVKRRGKLMVATMTRAPTKDSAVYDSRSMQMLQLEDDGTDLEALFSNMQLALIHESERAFSEHLDMTHKRRELLDRLKKKNEVKEDDPDLAVFVDHELQRQKVVDYIRELRSLHTVIDDLTDDRRKVRENKSSLPRLFEALEDGTELTNVERAVISVELYKDDIDWDTSTIKSTYLDALHDVIGYRPDCVQPNTDEESAYKRLSERTDVISDTLKELAISKADLANVQQYLQVAFPEEPPPTLEQVTPAVLEKQESEGAVTSDGPAIPWTAEHEWVWSPHYDPSQKRLGTSIQNRRVEYGQEPKYPKLPTHKGTNSRVNRLKGDPDRQMSLAKPAWPTGPVWTDRPVTQDLVQDLDEWHETINTSLSEFWKRIDDKIDGLASGYAIPFQVSIIDSAIADLAHWRRWKTLHELFPTIVGEMLSATGDAWDKEAEELDELVSLGERDPELDQDDCQLLKEWVRVAKMSTDPQPWEEYLYKIMEPVQKTKDGSEDIATARQNRLTAEESRDKTIASSARERERLWKRLDKHGFTAVPHTYQDALSAMVILRRTKRSKEPNVSQETQAGEERQLEEAKTTKSTSTEDRDHQLAWKLALQGEESSGSEDQWQVSGPKKRVPKKKASQTSRLPRFSGNRSRNRTVTGTKPQQRLRPAKKSIRFAGSSVSAKGTSGPRSASGRSPTAPYTLPRLTSVAKQVARQDVSLAPVRPAHCQTSSAARQGEERPDLGEWGEDPHSDTMFTGREESGMLQTSANAPPVGDDFVSESIRQAKMERLLFNDAPTVKLPQAPTVPQAATSQHTDNTTPSQNRPQSRSLDSEGEHYDFLHRYSKVYPLHGLKAPTDPQTQESSRRPKPQPRPRLRGNQIGGNNAISWNRSMSALDLSYSPSGSGSSQTPIAYHLQAPQLRSIHTFNWQPQRVTQYSTPSSTYPLSISPPLSDYRVPYYSPGPAVPQPLRGVFYPATHLPYGVPTPSQTVDSYASGHAVSGYQGEAGPGTFISMLPESQDIYGSPVAMSEDLAPASSPLPVPSVDPSEDLTPVSWFKTHEGKTRRGGLIRSHQTTYNQEPHDWVQHASKVDEVEERAQNLAVEGSFDVGEAAIHGSVGGQRRDSI